MTGNEEGQVVPGWDEGGFFCLDFHNPEFRSQVARQAKAAVDSGAVDGVMLDWWSDDASWGTTYKLVHGDLYRVSSPDRLVFVEKIYDKDFRKTNYASQDGRFIRVDTDTGKRYPTRRHFEDGFENADQITDLIGEQRGWISFTLQSSMIASDGLSKGGPQDVVRGDKAG